MLKPMAIELKSYPTPSDEMIGIAEEIEKLIRQDEVAPSEIAVVFRENKQLDEMAAYLQYKKIPFQLVRKENLLRNYFIQQIILMLEWVALEANRPGSGDHHLFKLLHFKWFDLPAELIARVQMDFIRQKFVGQESFRLYLQDLQKQGNQLFTPEEIQKLKSVSDLLEAWIRDVYNEPLQNFFCRVLDESRVLKMASQAPDSSFLIHLMKTLFEFLQAENQRNPDLTLEGWIQIIRKMEKYKLTIPYESQIGDEHCVQLLTAHGTKGLEFDYVFIDGCVEKNWEKKRGRNIGFSLPPALKIQMSSYSQSDLKEEDERRLFYVALTRARKYVQISYAEKDNQGNTLQKSEFLDEILISSHIIVNPQRQAYSQQNSLTDFYVNILQDSLNQAMRQQYSQSFLQHLVSNFKLNPTALNKYLYCPRSFFYESLLQVPQAQLMHSIYGQAIHHALKQVANSHSQGNGVNIGKAQNDFEWFMHQNRHHFKPDDFVRHLQHGNEVLQNYLNQVFSNWGNIKETEKDFQAHINHVPIKGRLDKIEIQNGITRVVDYKTGNPDRADNKLRRYNPENGKKGYDDHDYWIQAVMYVMLLQENGYTQVDTVVFDFVEPDKTDRFRTESVSVDSSDITLVEQLLTYAWEQIQSLSFPCCQRPDCHWCAFEQTLAAGAPVLGLDKE
ncbi:PD-(D/E)XK nuclease superfamily protein [Thermoflavifilum aggregans]|uniref:DNA 3'-5' helicase II n=2 Tax=Thermoflavifilum aggregans TaxID=454188 RepID=A0A2M9CS20_9BACT|nr:PD-(D/E)XK nuclease superfamily protein [Thermoflavifilum aggregans]